MLSIRSSRKDKIWIQKETCRHAGSNLVILMTLKVTVGHEIIHANEEVEAGVLPED